MKYHSMTTSTYDVHNICNLRCEGCSYFVTDRVAKMTKPTDSDYHRFFAQEVGRGVNYPIFSGAEPSLNQGPLAIAAQHWRYGAVFTNGIRPIDRDLPFRVVVSLWSGPGKSRKLRGASSYRKALRSAAGDKRAIVFLTVTSQSIDDIPEVVADCASHGVPVSFNFYSMTSEYRRRLEQNVANDDAFFRFSTTDNSLALDAEDRRRAANIIDACISQYPDTVRFHRALSRFMAQDGPMHQIEPVTGLATDCAVLRTRTHLSFNYDLSRDDRKDCCAPDFDCRDCRVLGAALGSLIMRTARATTQDVRSTVRELRELRQLMMRLYYWDWIGSDASA